MDLREVKERIANYLLDCYPTTARAHSKGMVTDEGTISVVDLRSHLFTVEICQQLDALKLLEMPEKERGILMTDVLTMVNTFLQDQRTEQYRGPTDLPDSYVERFALIPINNIQADEMLLYNTHAKMLSEMNFKAWERAMDKETRAAALQRMRDAILVYDPYN